MELGAWRAGGRRPWTDAERVILTDCAGVGMSPIAIWRTGRLPGRSEAAIRSRLSKWSLWGVRKPHFDGERRELSLWVTPALKGRLKQRAQRTGISLSELVRRACEHELRNAPAATPGQGAAAGVAGQRPAAPPREATP